MQFTRFGIGRGRSGRLLAWSLAVGAGVGVVVGTLVGAGFNDMDLKDKKEMTWTAIAAARTKSGI